MFHFRQLLAWLLLVLLYLRVLSQHNFILYMRTQTHTHTHTHTHSCTVSRTYTHNGLSISLTVVGEQPKKEFSTTAGLCHDIPTTCTLYQTQKTYWSGFVVIMSLITSCQGSQLDTCWKIFVISRSQSCTSLWSIFDHWIWFLFLWNTNKALLHGPLINKHQSSYKWLVWPVDPLPYFQ